MGRAGCLDWQRDGLREPSSVKGAGEELPGRNGPAKQFVQEECTLLLGGQVIVENLYRAFEAWCRGRGDEPLAKKAFGTVLGGMNGLTQGKAAGQRCWKGIKLDPSELEPESGLRFQWTCCDASGLVLGNYVDSSSVRKKAEEKH